MKRLLLLLLLLLMPAIGLAETWVEEDVLLRGCLMTLQVEPLSDGLVQVRVTVTGQIGDGVLPEAFGLYTGGICTGYAEAGGNEYTGYAEADYVQSLAVVPIYDGVESGEDAVILSAPEEVSPVHWQAWNRASCGGMVNATAELTEDGLLLVQVMHTGLPDGAELVSAWLLYLNGSFETTLWPYPTAQTTYYYGAASPVGILRSVAVVPVRDQTGAQLKQAVTLDAE